MLKRTTLILFLLLAVGGAVLPQQPVAAAGLVPCGRSSDDQSTGGRDESDVCTLCHLIIGVNDLITWARNIMVVIAIAMIVAMGILYIVSLGNASMMSIAKKGIFGALIGIAIMLTAWLIVNVTLTILAVKKATFGSLLTSPNVFQYQCIPVSRANRVSGTGSPVAGAGGSGGGGGAGGGGTPGALPTALPAACAQYESAFRSAAASTGVPYSLLVGVAAQESGCNPNAVSPAGACGIMQIKPATAGASCAQLQSDPTYSIRRAAEILRANQTALTSYNNRFAIGNNTGQSGGTVSYGDFTYDTGNDDLIASYNGGTGSGTNGDGTRQPFATSTDCTSTPTPAWQCNINPGGFAETQDYVRRVQAYQDLAGA